LRYCELVCVTRDDGRFKSFILIGTCKENRSMGLAYDHARA
jgi:hypothetical protein